MRIPLRALPAVAILSVAAADVQESRTTALPPPLEAASEAEQESIGRLSSAPPTLDAACSGRTLVSQLAQSAEFEEAMRIKARTGYMPTAAERAQILLRIEGEQLASLTSALGAFSRRAPTAALIYGRAPPEAVPAGRSGQPINCIWLVEPGGIVASAQYAEDGLTAPVLWAGLRVSSSARRGRRTAAGCEPSAPPLGVERPPGPDVQEVLRAAARRLLPPAIAGALERQAEGRLIVVPTLDYRAVPFAALPLSDAALIDRFAIVVAPGYTSIVTAARTGAAASAALPEARSGLVVGEPSLPARECWDPLPHARAEAEYLRGRIGAANVLVGPDASFAEVTSRLRRGAGDLRLIYFATHGVADQVNPADGGYLALANRHLRGADIRPLRFARRPLVVMSACETGLGRTFAQGMFGLADLWRAAGASQVVMSSWRVSDSGTRQLMGHFVDELEAGRWQGAEFALARAMRRLRERNPDPAVWASFNIYGDPSG